MVGLDGATVSASVPTVDHEKPSSAKLMRICALPLTPMSEGPKAKLVLSVTMINRAVAVTFDVADVRKY